MDSRCDTGRIATISIPDGGSGVPTAVAAAPIPDRSKTVRPDHAATWSSSDPGSRRRPDRPPRRTLCAALRRAPASALAPGPLARRVCAAASRRRVSPAGVLDPRGPIAEAERLLLINSTAIMMVVVVPVIVATLAFAWWYRASNPRAARRLDPAYEGRIEFVAWSIPALIVILLGGVIWIGSHQLDPARRSPPGRAAAGGRRGARLEVAVHLPRSGRCHGQPTGRAQRNSTRFGSSATVMNSFSCRSSAARSTRWLDGDPSESARRPARRISGVLGQLQRRRLCRHAVIVKACRRRFRRWLGTSEHGPALDDAAYAALAKPSKAVPPATYGSVEAKLFERMVSETIRRRQPPGQRTYAARGRMTCWGS